MVGQVFTATMTQEAAKKNPQTHNWADKHRPVDRNISQSVDKIKFRVEM
jgi:hypothetical protein